MFYILHGYLNQVQVENYTHFNSHSPQFKFFFENQLNEYFSRISWCLPRNLVFANELSH